MNRYAYGYFWQDKDGITRKTYLEAGSQVEADAEFERITQLSIVRDNVATNRQRV